MERIKAKAAKDFALALSCRETIHVKKGDTVEVDPSSVPGMVDAGQIKRPKGSDFAAKLDGQMTKKSVAETTETTENELDGETVKKSFAEMTKNELEAYGREKFGVELDKRKSKDNLIAEIEALETPVPFAVGNADNSETN